MRDWANILLCKYVLLADMAFEIEQRKVGGPFGADGLMGLNISG